LNRNSYSQDLSEEWEIEVFFRNVKSFNFAMGEGYNVDLGGHLSELTYN